MRGIKTRESGKWKKISVFIILLIIFIFLLNSVHNVYKKKKEADGALAHMKEQVVDLGKREKFLADSLERLTTNDGIKFEIRKKLNVAEVGESVAVIVDENQSASTTNQSVSSWQKIKNFFSSLFE